MAWGKAGSTTLSGSGTDLSVTSMANSVSGMALGSHSAGGTSIKFNNDNGSNGSGNYAVGRSSNGGAKSNNASRNGDNAYITDVRANPHFNVTYFINIASEEKLWINSNVHQNTAGAGTAPAREKGVGKWVNTSDAISQMDYHCWNGTYSSGDNITVLGSDLTPAAAVTALATNLQVGTRFEETDTRKMYNYTGISESELKAYYHFEDNGTNAQTTGDGLGSSANMTVTGATYATGKVGSKAISFDGTNDYTVIGSSTSDFNFLANTTHEWTVAFWFKNASWGSTEMILSTGNELSSSRFGLGIRAQSSGSIYVHFCNGTNQNRFTTTQTGFSTDGNWHFIVITAKKSDSTNSLEFWEDGTSLGTASNSGKDFVDTNASQAPYIGQAGDSSQWLSGQLDELSIWNRRLSDSEISTLYNSGTGKVIEIWQEIGA